MSEPLGALTFLLIVPSGTWPLDFVASRIRGLHDAPVEIGAVWCGDPHRRPPAPSDGGWSWADLDLAEPSGTGWGLLLAALPARSYEWARAAAAARTLLDAGHRRVLVIRVRSVAVLGDCSTIAEAGPSIALVRRPALPDHVDGLAPSERDLVLTGRYSTVVASFGSEAGPALQWLGDQLADVADIPVGIWLDRMAERFGARVLDEHDVAMPGWGGAVPDGIALADLDALDPQEPWRVRFGDRPARVRLSTDPRLAALVADAAPQLAGTSTTVALPGGILLDPAVGACVRGAIQRHRSSGERLPPEPFGGAGSTFLRWLEENDAWGPPIGRYWMETWAQRPDLRTVFPRPLSLDEWRLRDWADAAWRLEDRFSALLSPFHGPDRTIVSVGRERGVNLLGYLGFDQSQGHVARELAAVMEAAGIPVGAIDHVRSQAPRTAGTADDRPREARYDTNVVVVNPDQFEFVVADHGATLLAGRRTIGYWFWELEDVPQRLVEAIEHVDEIWAGSRFIADAFRRVTTKPVHVVSLPIVEPTPSTRTRASFGLPDDAYVFLATFDQYSVPERKNPFGAIDAFTRAFPAPVPAAEGGPMLVIKTINGDRSWRHHERLLLAAAGRPDVVVWDEHLGRADQMAVLDAADCVVSLHRSEGLGMHCAEAMWLSKPVIATAYSGNLDFMDETVAAMVGFRYVPVVHGEGIYPEGARWADPDLDQAADWMRRLVAEPALGREMGRRARRRMLDQPSAIETGHRIAELLGMVDRRG